MKTQFRIPAILFVVAILATMFVVSCKDDDTTPPPDLTALKASIQAATDALNAAVTGNAEGQYPADAVAALQAAITAGQIGRAHV